MGHSQGGAQILSGLADRPDYFLDAVNQFLLIAPACRGDRCLHKNLDFILSTYLKNPGMIEQPVPPPKALLRLIYKTGLEDRLIKYMTDMDPSKCSEIGKHTVGGHSVGGASSRCFEHFSQIVKSKRFQKYDFGAEGNKEAYGSESVPEIDLRSFSGANISMFCGKEDLMVSPGDYHWLKEELSAKDNLRYFKEYDLGHVGLMIPKDRTVFYDMLAVAKHFAPEGKVSIR